MTETGKDWGKRVFLPDHYQSYLSFRDTETAIKKIKDSFQARLTNALDLSRVSAPLVVLQSSGINDYLCGWEKPAGFYITDMGETGEVVQSLAKWKRNALADYEFKPGEGLYTDMNAIRPQEDLDYLHSLYVDQWDWERVMHPTERNLGFLKMIVRHIYQALVETEREICAMYPVLPKPYLPDDIYFIHSQDLEDAYPDLSPKERENQICEKYGAVFVIGIGHPLQSGNKHDDRATDYDDWISENEDGYRGLNGDILVWNSMLGQAFEISSMGIRVNAEALLQQLDLKAENHKKTWPYQQKLLSGQLPQSIGGGLGQSRICMLLLRKVHVGEVQASIWPDDMIRICKEAGIPLL